MAIKGFLKTFYVLVIAMAACASVSSCSKEPAAIESVFVGTWDCTESNEPNGIFETGDICIFDAAGIFYKEYNGEWLNRGTFNGNKRDLYMQTGSYQIHWDVTFLSDTKVSLYSTRSGYPAGTATIVKRK